MTGMEWARIGARIMTYWPARTMSAATLEAWYEELGKFDQDEVIEAARALALTEDRAPSLAKLLAGARAQRRRKESGRPTLAYDPSLLPDGVRALASFAEIADVAVTYSPWRVAEIEALAHRGLTLVRVVGAEPVDRRVAA